MEDHMCKPVYLLIILQDHFKDGNSGGPSSKHSRLEGRGGGNILEDILW